jgi:hypothetical protein
VGAFSLPGQHHYTTGDAEDSENGKVSEPKRTSLVNGIKTGTSPEEQRGEEEVIKQLIKA